MFSQECIEAPEPEGLGVKIECSATQKSVYVKATVLGFPEEHAAYRRILELSDGSLKDDHGHALKMPILPTVTSLKDKWFESKAANALQTGLLSCLVVMSFLITPHSVVEQGGVQTP